jgi:hypothetical protein
MLSKLVRQLGMLLLATSLITSPVLASMPRCCQTGAIAGGGNCCCGPREEVEELPSCCQQAARSCCAKAADAKVVGKSQSDSVNSLSASSAPCSCKTIHQMPALATAKDRIETHEQQLNVVAVSTDGASTSQLALSSVWELQQAEPSGIPLHKVHCRWTI